ncbi:MAG: STAS domain-containing protein [Oculatellaceae cyanobacterium bins.114]|nr:STAS domain-containing protein [Oculatellaceae cyanobacterium bins.114]
MATPYVFQLKTRLLSAATAPELLYWINNILELGATHLLLDMKDVLFMDSSGLGALVIAHNRVQKAGGKLMLCSLSGQARMLFELSGMEKVFEVYSDKEDFEKAS